MSTRWYVACWDCERTCFVDKAVQIYDAAGADIWTEHPPHPLDVAQVVLFIKAHNGHRIGVYPDNDDPVLGEFMEWKDRVESFVPSKMYRKFHKKMGWLANGVSIDSEGNFT